jgi:farnesyl diphosphate synthase
MYMAGISSPEAHEQAQSILLPLGEYFQVQDDYLDCYGDPAVIGKIGTDIQDNKCSWLVCQALKRASPAQRKILEENYGRKNADCEAKVKQLYVEMGLKSIYEEYEEKSHQQLTALIEQLDGSLPKDMFFTFMDRIYKRKK